MKISIAKNPPSLPFAKIIVITLAANIFTLVAVLSLRANLPPVVPLFYNKPLGEAQLVSSPFLAIPSAVSAVIVLVNTLLATLTKDEFLQRLLIIASLGATTLSTITTVKIILLVGSF